MSTVIHSKVAGVSFCTGYPDNIHKIHEMINAIDLHPADNGAGGTTTSEQLAAVLIRNPENEFDPNAVQVHVPALGEEYGMVGHLARGVASRVAPLLDAGAKVTAEIDPRIHWEHTDRPGAEVIITIHPDDP